MLVPVSTSATLGRFSRLSLIVLCCGLSSLLFAAPKLPESPRHIPLGPLGYFPPQAQFLAAGSSLFTLHYMDDHHLLVTFTVRRLMPRIAEDPPEDMDHTVDALLLETPSGRILARTTWRLHDHAHYLWNLGGGRFLLRIRDTFTTFAPLDAEPFTQYPFLALSRRVVSVQLSTDSQVLLIQSVKYRPAESKPPPAPFKAGPPDPKPNPPHESDSTPVQIDFYRLALTALPRPHLIPRVAGRISARTPVYLPLLSTGYINVVDQGRQHWAFDFNFHSGKVIELAAFDSSCRPRPVLVSTTQFLAFGCHGGTSPQTIGAFNLRGDQMWEQHLFDNYFAPTFSFAPQSGRFAFGRLSTLLPVTANEITSGLISSQTVVVYQTESGRELLKVLCDPIQRAGQNFDLSPDGNTLAIVNAQNIDLYTVPPATIKEIAADKLTRALNPQDADPDVRVTLTPKKSTKAKASPGSDNNDLDNTMGTALDTPTQPPSGIPVPPPSSPAALAPNTPAAPSPDPAPQQKAPTSPPQPQPQPEQVSPADPSPQEPRKPPTLYNPGEAPKTKSEAPKPR